MPHIHEKYDFTVGFFIVFEGKVLLVNHPRYGLWLSPGGHVELDEDTDEALYREIQEETGYKPNEIEILSSKPPLVSSLRQIKALFTPNYMDVHEANAPHKHIALTYFVKAKHGKFIQSAEHTDAKWLSTAEMENSQYNIPAEVKYFAREAIKTAELN